MREYWMMDDNVSFVQLKPAFFEDRFDGGRTWNNKQKTNTVGMLNALEQARSKVLEIERNDDNRVAVAGFAKTNQQGPAKHNKEVFISEAGDAQGPVDVYKCFLIRTALTRNIDFIPGLVCAEDIDFQFRVFHAGGRIAKIVREKEHFSIPTFHVQVAESNQESSKSAVDSKPKGKRWTRAADRPKCRGITRENKPCPFHVADENSEYCGKHSKK